MPRQVALRATVMLVILAGLSACTAGLVYNRLDWVVSWYVNGMMSLDDAQERQLREIVRKTMHWHRETQLPGYVLLLERMADESDRPATVERLEQFYREVGIFLDDFIRQVMPDVAGFMRTVSSAQLAELAESFEEDNEDLWDEYAGVTPEIRHKRRVKNAVRFIQRFVGRLTDEQRALIDARLAGMYDISDQWLERRRHWQNRFFSLLKATPPDPGLEAALLDMALDPNQFDSAEYHRRAEENRKLVMSMIADLSVGMSPRQREHLRRKFQEYADDIEKIAADN